MNIADILRRGGRRLVENIEHGFDRPFGGSANPLRHLGALGFALFGLIVLSGIYLFVVIDTSVEGAYRSVKELSLSPPGGLLRSLHRYAADAFVVVAVLHLLREFLLGRSHGFRWFSWISGVPLLWLIYVSGIGGYWLPWDARAQFSAVATAEWLDWLAIFADPITRNFLTPAAVNDRFFSLLVFVHLGVPLLLLVGLWVHVQRIGRADWFPSRTLAAGTLTALIWLALLAPVHSQGAADLTRAPTLVSLDWFYLFLHPLTYATSAAVTWSLIAAATLLLFALPLLPHPPRPPVAIVNPANCNGCGRCAVDCPYAAVAMVRRDDASGYAALARVTADCCAGCGICAGSCPTSTPFRAATPLVPGIDMPGTTIDALRRELDDRFRAATDSSPVVVFGCRHGADVNVLAGTGAVPVSLICAGQLPPTFIEYAMRLGASGVMVVACREGGCEFRLGSRWLRERISGRRDPRLRLSHVPEHRLRQMHADRSDGDALKQAFSEFKAELGQPGPQAGNS